MPSPFLQGKYKPDYPEKYRGDPNDIVFRSSWELIAFKWCDHDAGIVAWSSESVIIPYRGVDGRMHRYFMDLWVIARQPDGSTRRFLIEIKPKSKMNMPKRTAAKKDESFLRELNEYYTNQRKWEAARAFCQQNNMEFKIWTEDVLLPTAGKFVPTKSIRRTPRKPTRPH